MNVVPTGELLQQALRGLDDDQLDRLRSHADAFARAVNDDPLTDRATRSAALGLYVLVADIPAQRFKLEEHARITLEPNGHEVWVDEEPTVGWWAYCHCLDTPDPEVPGFLGDGAHTTREEAEAICAEHAAEHGGAWVKETT